MKIISILLASILISITSLSIADDMSSKNNCLLAIDVSMLENNNYDNAFEKAPKACIDATGLTICWDDFEKKPSKYKLVIK